MTQAPPEWRPLSEIGDVAYADWLVSQGIPRDDWTVIELRKRARPAQPQESMSDIVKRELKLRGWREDSGPNGRRRVKGWRHADGERAMSLNDAIIRQMMREMS
jgi:hypothetical protein